jgi:hypothetical protein
MSVSPWLGANNPPVKEAIAKEMMDYARHDFNARMIQTSIARLQCVAAEGIQIVNAVDEVETTKCCPPRHQHAFFYLFSGE